MPERDCGTMPQLLLPISYIFTKSETKGARYGPSTQHGERYNKMLEDDILCGKRASKEHLLETIIPKLLKLDSESTPGRGRRPLFESGIDSVGQLTFCT